MASPPDTELIDNSLSQEQRDVLLACAQSFTGTYRCIHIRPLGRFGYTSAQLFEARFDQAGRGAPYVVKIDTLDHINDEESALEQARAHFPGAANAHRVDPDAENGLAALIYPLVANEDEEIVEFRDLYERDGVDHNTLCGVIDSVYHTCRYAHSPTTRQVRLGAEYDRYNRASRPDRVIEAFGPGPDPIDLFGERYPHPSTSRETLASVDTDAPTNFVHGDLHPNNIVLGAENQPSLIDFAWAHDGDITKDFVLMECSARFLLFPTNVPWHAHHWVAQQLVLADGAAAVRDRFASDPTQPHAERYERMARVVETIRSRAATATGSDFDFRHYLTAQFLVLYGLSRISAYSFHSSVDVLGLISRELGV